MKSINHEELTVYRICNHCNKEHVVDMLGVPDSQDVDYYDCPLCGKRNALWIRIVMSPPASSAPAPDCRKCELYIAQSLRQAQPDVLVKLLREIVAFNQRSRAYASFQDSVGEEQMMQYLKMADGLITQEAALAEYEKEVGE
jgi:transcription elongation factor Elf1